MVDRVAEPRTAPWRVVGLVGRIAAAAGLVWGSLTACAWAPDAPQTSVLPRAVERGEGFAVEVVEGSRTHVVDGVLNIDGPDGFRWQEARWIEGAVAPAVTRWGADTCEGVIWERPGSPIQGVRTQIGLCTRQGQEYWTFVALETRGERTLMLCWLGHRQRVPYEQAWVEFTGTVLTLQGASEPLHPIDEEHLRSTLRATSVTSTGPSPIPGGGELGAATSEALPELWRARLAAPDPRW